MEKYNRHVKTMLRLRDKLEDAYKNAQSDKDREDIIWKLVDYRLIKSDDTRLRMLSPYSRKDRDARKSKMASYVAKCPYFQFEHRIEVPVTIQPHDGTRSYKETVWYVKYPSSKTYIRLEELCEVQGYKEIKDNIDKIVLKQGCEWEDIRDDNFHKMVMNGMYLVYKVMFKNLTSTMFDFCGYVFVEKIHDGDKLSANIVPIIDKELLASKHVIANAVEGDLVDAVRVSLDKALRDSIRKKEDKIKAEQQKALEEEERAKKKSKGKSKKKNDSEENDEDAAALEAEQLRMALGMLV